MKKVFNLLLLFITFHLLASLTQMVRAMIQRQAPYVSFVMGMSQEQESLPYLLVLGRPFVHFNFDFNVNLSIWNNVVFILGCSITCPCPSTLSSYGKYLDKYFSVSNLSTEVLHAEVIKGTGAARYFHYCLPDPSCFPGLNFVSIILNGNIFIIPNKCLALANIKHFFVRIKTHIHTALLLTFYWHQTKL